MSRETALITGAGQGIGKAIALGFARLGINVVVNDINEESARLVAEEARVSGVNSLAVKADVSRKSDIKEMAKKIEEWFPGVDILVNNAGIVRNAGLLNVSEEDLDLTLSVHLKGTLNCTQAIVPKMKQKKYGRIVNISSIAIRGATGGTSYVCAKSAIVGLTRVTALELAAHNITVNCVAPGLVETNMFYGASKKFRDLSIAKTPMKRPGKPEEIAACVLFLASKEASYITGQTIFICGGLSIGSL